MNYFRAISVGLAMFIGSLVICAVGAKLVGIDLKSADPENIPAAMRFMGIVSAAILCAAGSLRCFKFPKIVASAGNGFLSGLFRQLRGRSWMESL
jgi:hypothetical protein